jgi:hypothetical protein
MQELVKHRVGNSDGVEDEPELFDLRELQSGNDAILRVCWNRVPGRLARAHLANLILHRLVGFCPGHQD